MIKELVNQLSDAQFKSLSNSLSVTKANKFYQLLLALRDGDLTEKEIREQLNISTQAYYTLKSRLLDKIQKFQLYATVEEEQDLALTVQAIPRIIHEQTRIQALGSLLLLAEELKRKDMPWELVQVYAALMKICTNENKYYEFSSEYNKHVAFALALDKAGDLLSRYNAALRKFYFDGSDQTKELCFLLLKELKNISELYSSHRLRFYYTLAGIIHKMHFRQEGIANEQSVEFLFNDAESIVQSHPEDPKYRVFHLGIESLKFQYYHKLELHDSNRESMRIVNENLSAFVQLTYCVPMYSYFQALASRLTTIDSKTKFDVIMNDIDFVGSDVSIEEKMHQTLLKCAIHSAGEEYIQVVKLLGKALGDLSFKSFPVGEIYFKLLLCYYYLLCKKQDQAESELRSVTRKYKEDAIFKITPAGAAFCKFLKCAIADHSKQREMNLHDYRDVISNRKRQDFLFPEFLSITDKELSILI